MKTPYLNYFCENLNNYVKTYKHQNAISRKEELSTLIQTLLHVQKNTPMIIGEAGVGKTDLVEGLAQMINNNSVPPLLTNYTIFSLQVGLLDQKMSDDSEDTQLGYFNYNLEQILKECKQNNDRIILFIDEFHTLMGANRHGGMDGSQLLKPSLARGELHLIGATTFDEFYEYVEPDRALQRRLDVINLAEPSKKQTLTILKNNLTTYYNHYNNIKCDDGVLQLCIDLSIRYLTDRFLPDKAFDILDAAFAEAYISNHNKIQELDVETAIYRKTGIPLKNIANSLQPQIADLEQQLHKNILGQNEAISQIVKSIDMFFAGLNDASKPKDVFLFLGTTGVGKTEVAKTLAKILFGAEDNMVRFDMGEYTDKTAVNKLMGEHGQQGLLTAAIRRRPYCILLLDEIEKADSAVWDLLLSIIDDGEIKDSRGRLVDFTNSIIIMTSNLASETIKNKNAWERGSSDSPEEKKYRETLFRRMVNNDLKTVFRPEFVNRIPNKVIFNVLGKKEIVQISKKYIFKLIDRLKKQGIDFTISFDALDYLTDLGTDVDNGARPLQHVLDEEVTGYIAKQIVANKNEFQKVKTVELTVSGSRPFKTEDESDLYGTRSFKFSARLTNLSPTEIVNRERLFDEASIQKMLQKHVDKPKIELNIKK